LNHPFYSCCLIFFLLPKKKKEKKQWNESICAAAAAARLIHNVLFKKYKKNPSSYTTCSSPLLDASFVTGACQLLPRVNLFEKKKRRVPSFLYFKIYSIWEVGGEPLPPSCQKDEEEEEENRRKRNGSFTTDSHVNLERVHMIKRS